MKRRLLLSVCCSLIVTLVHATRITGTITDEKGGPLGYASILVKGTTRGVTAGHEGTYVIELAPGDYTLVCQFVGYGRVEKKIRVGASPLTIDFQLFPQQLSMAEVVVRPGGEDPAYAIIRHAIKKRKDYQDPLDSFTCEAYIKTQIKSRGLPKKILGQKIEEKDKEEMGVDSMGKGILFLSESLTKVSYKKPDKIKLEVLSGRKSGSNGYGLTIPTFVNFYDNNVNVLGTQLSPRGFVSPIAASALTYYRYKYLGSFFEDGREINKIQVIPRRKYEPLFSGTINIVEGEWRIHSLDLLLVKESQLQILDTLEIRQLQAPVGTIAEGRRSDSIWQAKDQVTYFTFKILGVDAVGNFLNVYNDYDITPSFRKHYFNNVLMKYDTAGDKKSKAYWDSIRPVPLEPDEQQNYTIRDSIYNASKDSLLSKKNRDSLLKKQGPIKFLQITTTGFTRSNFRQPRPLQYALDPILSNIEYNTVEGLNMNIDGSISRALKNNKDTWIFSPHIRYGFHNTRLNPWASLTLNSKAAAFDGKDMTYGRHSWTIAGGKRVSQFNHDRPISEYINGLYTLFFRRNYMKLYENYFVALSHTRRLDNGLRVKVDALYEDRLPLNNTSDYSLIHYDDRPFTPNYPFEKISAPFPRHQAFLTSVGLQFQPGQRYIEFPDNKVPLGSSYPTLSLEYTKGWKTLLGSDVDYDKWQFSVWHQMNLRLKGLLKYRLSAGGFLNTHAVFIQDYQHFNGNQTIFANAYMNGFQLAPYYANSTIASFYATGHIEHHFNGLLTNKIPLFRRLNWWLVGGSNAFYVNSNNHYEEVFGGLENIFKFFRVDWVGSYLNGHYYQTGIRLGMGGLLGSGLHSSGR